jgi:hypothetical protein
MNAAYYSTGSSAKPDARLPISHEFRLISHAFVCPEATALGTVHGLGEYMAEEFGHFRGRGSRLLQRKAQASLASPLARPEGWASKRKESNEGAVLTTFLSLVGFENHSSARGRLGVAQP